MLLDRIDIDGHGPLHHVELGPFAEHLNVIAGPRGSGKTAIVRFIRDSLVQRDYPQGMLSASSGRVVWADRNGMIHCRREQDGTATGRRTVEFESRGQTVGHLDSLGQSWFGDASKSTDSGRAFESLQFPESIVDGVITDTAITSVARVVSACVRSGLDSPETYNALPLHDETIQDYDRNRRLRQQLAEIEAELSRLQTYEHPASNQHDDGINQLHDRARQLQARQSELRSWVSEIDRELNHAGFGGSHFESTEYQYGSSISDQTLRRRLNRFLQAVDCYDHSPIGDGFYRESLLRDGARDQRESVEQLNRVTAELDACLQEAVEMRRSMRSLPIIDRRWNDDFSYENIDRQSYMGVRHALADGYHRWTDSSAFVRQIESLRRRRAEILEQLRVVQPSVASRSPLADAASHWLIRLSGGRLHQIAWPYSMFGDDRRSHHAETDRRTGVTIDRRDEQCCSAADRALAVIAVRMAAGDLLARTGRSVPLVIETDGEPFDPVNTGHDSHASFAYHDRGDLARNNRPIASALRDYAGAGRQIVLLTTDQSLAAELSRIGARSYQLHASPIVHAHRPLWKAHYEAEHYVGPHPHTDAHGYRGNDVESVTDSERGTQFVDSSHRTDWPRDGYGLRDGYYAANSFTTVAPEHQTYCNHDGRQDGTIDQNNGCSQTQAKRVAAPDSPFFLTVDSPVDQAPSVDAVAAARLRGLNITHINHLMQQDSNRLADALGLIRVDATTIRRWKAESRLVCQVPQLRGFDARVLVGCGVTAPAQLAAIHPVDLLHQVETFLATDRGQQILLSGSSHELSRITSWIATANSTDGARVVSDRAADSQSRRRKGRRNDSSGAGSDSQYVFDSTRYEDEKSDGSSRRPGRKRRYDNETTDSESRRRSGTRRGSRSSMSRSGTDRRSSRRDERSDRDSKNRTSPSSRRSSSRNERESGDLVRYERDSSQGEPQQNELRFYLQRENQIVDAPSIGDRMAERLNGIGLFTVDDLLNADPETLAAELDHRGVDSERVLQWQQQATLVCRVPMLRGHDAQLLVAAEVTTPEELVQWDASELLGVVDPIARSSEGKRIIRGGKLPDLEEVTNWISFGSQHRELLAA